MPHRCGRPLGPNRCGRNWAPIAHSVMVAHGVMPQQLKQPLHWQANSWLPTAWFRTSGSNRCVGSCTEVRMRRVWNVCGLH